MLPARAIDVFAVKEKLAAVYDKYICIAFDKSTVVLKVDGDSMSLDGNWLFELNQRTLGGKPLFINNL